MMAASSVARFSAAMDVVRLIVWLNLLGIAKRLLPLRTLIRWAAGPRVAKDRRDIPTIAGRVLRAGRFAGMPDRDCLQRSLVLFRELSRAGVPAELFVGFRQTTTLEGHAWIAVEGRLVADEQSAIDTFVPALRVSCRGGVEHLQPASARP